MKPTLKPNDLHLVVDGKTNKAKLFKADGTLLKTFECFPHGANGPSWHVNGGDTVPGLYQLGAPQWTLPSEDVGTVKRPYGHAFMPLIDIEGKEAAEGRAGIGLHGGGSIKDYWAPRQELTYTMGCIRMRNEDVVCLGKIVEATHRVSGKVWLTVTQ